MTTSFEVQADRVISAHGHYSHAHKSDVQALKSTRFRLSFCDLDNQYETETASRTQHRRPGSVGSKKEESKQTGVISGYILAIILQRSCATQ